MTGNEKLKVTTNPKWLHDHLDEKNLRILDARSRGAYRKAHIPGAVHADLFHYFVPGTDKKGLAQFHTDLTQRLGRIGLVGKETAIVYESEFGMRAARVAWMLEYAGMPRVFLLEGGFRAWKKARFRVEEREARPPTVQFHIRPCPKLLATAGDILPARGVILDVRSKSEFFGYESRECDERKGRVPGSRWLEWSNFLDNATKFRGRREMADVLKQNTLGSNTRVVTYCHRGARAAAAFYALRSLGFNNVRNYIGSWHEWSARRHLPLEMGPVRTRVPRDS